MLKFQFYQRVRILYGNGCIKQLGELVDFMGSKKAMVVCDAGIISTGMVDKVKESLEKAGIEYVIFDKVQPNPPIKFVEEGAEICKNDGCDCVIGIGGGSNIDTAKGINCLRFNEGPITRFENMDEHMNLSPGLIIIPTTSGTGSEVSDGMILSDEEHNKHPILATNAMADYAILDPELLVGMPKKLTMSTGLDAFSHAVESYISTDSTPFVDFFDEKNMEEIIEYLPRVLENGNDLEARGKMAVCATIGGWMLGYGHTVAGHSIGHVVGGLFNIPHGIAVMTALPYVIEFSAVAIPEKTKNIGILLGATFDGTETPEEIGTKTKDAMIHFRDDIVQMTPITDFSYDESRFEELAKDIEVEPFQAFNPRKMTAADALVILKKMFAK